MLLYLYVKYPGNSENLYKENSSPVGEQIKIDGRGIVRARPDVCKDYFEII